MEYIPILIVVSCTILILTNEKISLVSILKDNHKLFYNYTTGKKTWIDYVVFYAIPIIISITFVYFWKFIVDDNLANVLLTTFSILAAMQFSFLAVIVGISSKEDIGLKVLVIKETYSAISYSILVSLLNCLILIFIADGIFLINEMLSSLVVLSLTLNIFLTILLVLKRMYMLLNGDE